MEPNPSVHSVARSIDDLPGPRGLPLVGNLLQLRRPRIHQDVERWARRYGPVFRFRLGAGKILVIADHELLGTALRDRPDGFRRPAITSDISLEMGLIGPGLFSSEGEAWRNQRRMVMASFDPGHVKAYLPSLLKVARRLHGRWQRAAHAGASIDLQADLMRYTVDAIAGLAFGSDINTLESDDEVIQRHLDKIFPTLYKRLLSIVPTWRLVRDRQLDASVHAINAAIQGFIVEARKRLAADPGLRLHPGNLLEAMIAAADVGNSGVSDRDVAGNVLTMLLAGEDTTANTLAWMIYLLHRHPQALRLAQEEVRRVIADPAAVGPEQLGELAYLEACVHETMRLKPVAPFLVLQALRDTTIANVAVPTGTLVWGVMRHDSMDERRFANAGAFDPQRWIGEAGAAKRISMPFGAGPRVCPGRYLALLEMKIAMAMLLGRFDIEGVDTPDAGEAQERMAFTMMPVGLRMRLRERR
jgi:cytochrome P450